MSMMVSPYAFMAEAVPLRRIDPIIKGTSNVGGAATSISITIPNVVAADDLILIFARTSAQNFPSIPSGFAAFPGTPAYVGTAANASSVGLIIYYKIASGSEGGTSISLGDSGDYNIAGCMVIGDVDPDDPFDVISDVDVIGTASTSISWPEITTTVPKARILHIGAHEVDVGSSPYSTAAINLTTDITGWYEALIAAGTSGNGGGFTVFSGLKLEPGATGVTSTTMSSSLQLNMTIALKGTTGSRCIYLGRSSDNFKTGTGNTFPLLPRGYIPPNAVLLLVVESQDGTVNAPTNWTQVASSPQFANAGNVTKCSLFWRRMPSSGYSNPTVADPGDHNVSSIFVFDEVAGTGDPFNATAGDTLTTASTTITFPDLTPTEDKSTIVAFATTGADAATLVSNYSAAGLRDFSEIGDFYGSSGAGGNIVVASGIKETAGAVGSMTATLATSQVQARITVSLKPYA